MSKRDPFKYFKTSPEIIRLAVMLYIRFPLSLRNVEDMLYERGLDNSHYSVRYWWNTLVRRVRLRLTPPVLIFRRRSNVHPRASARSRLSPSLSFAQTGVGCQSNA